MSLEEKYGQPIVKNKFLMFLIGLVVLVITLWGPITGWMQAQADEKETSIYESEEGSYVVSYWKGDQLIPFMNGWVKEPVKSFQLKRNESYEFWVEVADKAGKLRNIPCRNVVIESHKKARLEPKPEFHISHPEGDGYTLGVRSVKKEDHNHRYVFTDAYGNDGSWYCPDNKIEKIPLLK